MGGQTVNEKSSTTKNYVIFCTFVPTKTGWAIAYQLLRPCCINYSALTTQQVSDVNSQQGVKP